MALNYAELLWLASAEVLVVITALAVLGVDLKLRNSMSLEGRRSVALGLGALGCVVGMVWLLGMAPNGVAPKPEGPPKPAGTAAGAAPNPAKGSEA